jgi:hypothetical protein
VWWLGYGLKDRDSSPCRCSEGILFSLPPCPDRLWGPPSLLSTGYRGLFTGDKTSGACSRRFRMCWAIPPLFPFAFMACCLVKHRRYVPLSHSST